jgi:hypothetical protein
MVIKYTKILHCKTLQNFPKIGIFGLKTNHLATLVDSPNVNLNTRESQYVEEKIPSKIIFCNKK